MICAHCSKTRNRTPKIVHDWKTTTDIASQHWAATRCAAPIPDGVTDTMLLSYAINPTHATQSLVDVVARSGQSVPVSLAGAAHAIQTLLPTLRAQVAELSKSSLFTRPIDLPPRTGSLPNGTRRRSRKSRCPRRAITALRG